MTSLQKLAGVVAIAMLAGIAVGTWVTGDRPTAEKAATTFGESAQSDADERLQALEQMLLEEREAREALEGTLAMLLEELDGLGVADERTAAEREVRQSRQAVALQETRGGDRSNWAQDFNQRRISRMVEHGMTEEEARNLIDQESAASYEAMRAAWEAERSGQAFDPFAAWTDPQRILRDSIGDAAFERYLEAQGQPTTVEVMQVLGGSPGAVVGLEPGDQISSYNGERVFGISDLRRLTMQGKPGEDVVIEVIRDGVIMQLSLPAGPIGITGSGARSRAMNWWGG